MGGVTDGASNADRQVSRLIIGGRVQGVGYRWWCVAEARRHGLDGWVRNRTNGTVEAVLAGPSAAVQAMIALCRQGPSMARVDRLQVMEAADPGSTGFKEEATR